MPPLSDVPFYGAFIERQNQIGQQQARDLAVAKTLADMQREQEMRDALKSSGGDVEQAMQIAVRTGNVNAAHQLAPLVRMEQEKKQRQETQRGLAALTQQGNEPQSLADLTQPQGQRPRGLLASVQEQPQELGIGQPISIAGEPPPQPAAPASPLDARQASIDRLNKLSLLYANNPVVIQRIQAEIDKLAKPEYKTRTYQKGEESITEELQPDGTWKELGRGPKFAKQVEAIQNPNALLGKEETEFMAGQYLGGDRTVLQNLGRGQQGAENIVRLRREITRQAREAGASPKDVAAIIAEFEGFKAGQRALGTREAQIEMVANVTKQFAPLAIEASEKFDRTKYKSLNDVEKAVMSRTSSPELRRFNFANTSLINAYARAVNPSGIGTVSDKDHAREILDTGFSKGDYAAAVDQLLKEIDAELKAPGTVKRGMRSFFTGNEAPGPGPTPGAPRPPTRLRFDARGNPIP